MDLGPGLRLIQCSVLWFKPTWNFRFDNLCGNFADSQPALDSILRYHLNFEIQAFIFHRGINTIAGHALFAFMFRIRMISLPINADMRLYERICAHIFPIRIVYSDQIYIDRINSISMRFFCIFGYTYSMQISMWFHADMRSSMRINWNTYLCLWKKSAWPTL